MTLITHPLHQNTEIYIFCKKTHTSSTVSDFLSFQKTTGKITSTLWAPSFHIFYLIKSYSPFMTFDTSPKHLSICINIFCRKALTTSFLCNIICYINIELSLTTSSVLCIISLDWNTFLFWCNMSLYWDNLLVWYNTFSAWCITSLASSFLKNILCWSLSFMAFFILPFKRIPSINIISYKAKTSFFLQTFSYFQLFEYNDFQLHIISIMFFHSLY